MIRRARFNDISRVREIHEKFYKEEFTFADFMDKTMGMFVITDEEDDDIIIAGTIRPILESILITNKEYSVRERRNNLYKALAMSQYIAKDAGYTQFHAFIQDKKWQEHLEKSGFRPTKGNALVMDV